ncbi:MAG: STAS domain-containing protein [Burkholderiaceae bacterium]
MYQPPTRLTFAEARAAFRAGLDAIAAGQTEIDLGGVTTIDSSAVALLLAWRRAASAAGKPLRLLHLPAGLLSLAALYGVTALLADADAPARHRA